MNACVTNWIAATAKIGVRKRLSAYCEGDVPLLFTENETN